MSVIELYFLARMNVNFRFMMSLLVFLHRFEKREGWSSVSSSGASNRLAFLIIQSMISVVRSEEHTSELQSRFDLVCRLLLEKKKKPTESISEPSTCKVEVSTIT